MNFWQASPSVSFSLIVKFQNFLITTFNHRLPIVFYHILAPAKKTLNPAIRIRINLKYNLASVPQISKLQGKIVISRPFFRLA